MIFYFTGTGNSLYAAKQLDSDCRSIPRLLRSGRPLDFSAGRIGIAAPIYGHELPGMVKDFLKTARFDTNYFFLILTYGNRHANAVELARQFCDSCGLRVDYINQVLMVDNWLPSFDMDEQRRLDKQVDAQLAAIRADLDAGRHFCPEVTEADRAAHGEFLVNMSRLPADAWQHLLRVTDRCIGCGICKKVCPSGSIRVADGRAVHTPGRCQTCLACAHACPQKAIGLTVPEKNPQARYRNEHVTLQEIMQANGAPRG